jgi:hypothetical protein
VHAAIPFILKIVCLRCRRRLGYDALRNTMHALERNLDGSWYPMGSTGSFVFCDNTLYDGCNWVLPVSKSGSYCLACRHNGVVPDLSDETNLQKWQQIELAKHRLFYSLVRWKLPLQTRLEDPKHGLVFNFPSDPPKGPKVMTGHENGVITIALTEAHDVERENRRVQMDEPYRTLLGHFRHEVGHHYWDLLVRDQNRFEDFRSLFGDETQDYEGALKRHYKTGAPSNWQENYVSAYATSHP